MILLPSQGCKPGGARPSAREGALHRFNLRAVSKMAITPPITSITRAHPGSGAALILDT